MTIGIKGNSNDENSLENLKFILINERFRTVMRVDQYKRVLEGGPFKRINKRLEQFIGVYDVPIVGYPDWFQGFYNNLIISSVDSIDKSLSETVEKEFEAGSVKDATLLQSKKLLKLKEQFQAITPIMVFEGKLPNGQKILKFCKNTFEAMNPENKDKVLAEEWYKTYESKKSTSSEGVKIVITNDKVTNLSISSVFDNRDHGSCQSMWKYPERRGLCDGIVGNLFDTNSLVAYITEGNEKPIRCSTGNSPKTHQTMVTRVMLRLVVNKRTGQHYIVPDRAYPHNSYTPAIIKVLEDICAASEEDTKVGIHERWNSTSSGGKTINLKLKSETISVVEADAVEVATSPIVTYDDVSGEIGIPCNHSRDPERCYWSGEHKYKCYMCRNNGSVRFTGAYHDNLKHGVNIEEAPGLVRHSGVIKEIEGKVD